MKKSFLLAVIIFSLLACKKQEAATQKSNDLNAQQKAIELSKKPTIVAEVRGNFIAKAQGDPIKLTFDNLENRKLLEKYLADKKYSVDQKERIIQSVLSTIPASLKADIEKK